ncbi:MAG: GspH/FimT family protein [Phycisphaerales bacterium]|nr:GspH/FimT family protein [Phycisphaerales bacterium]
MRRRGFSLTEVLVVIAIIAIFGAIMTPMVAASRTGMADTTARLLWSDLEHAQMLAIARPNTRVALEVDGDGGGWRIIDLDNPTVPLTDALDSNSNARSLWVRLGEQRAVACEDVTISPSGRQIIFDPLGGLNTPGGPDKTLTVTGPLAVRIIAVDPDTGFVSLQTP